MKRRSSQEIRALLRAISVHLPGLQADLHELADEGMTAEQIGFRIGVLIAAELSSLQLQLNHLQIQAGELRHLNDELSSQNQLLWDYPARAELDRIRMQLAEQSTRADRAESGLASTREMVERERQKFLVEINTLQATVADLRRLVARQHMELVELMGDAYAERVQEPEDHSSP